MECRNHIQLPQSWQSLYTTLVSKSASQQVTIATEWYQEQATSKYGITPDWADLFDRLIQAEPIVDQGKLVFVPVFDQLRRDIQSTLLHFFLQKRDVIPTSCLSSFVDKVRSADPGSWDEIYFRMLSAYVKCKTGKETQSDTTPLAYQYSFTSTNNELASKLCQELKKTEKVASPWQHEIQIKGGLRETEQNLDTGMFDTSEKKEEQGAQKLMGMTDQAVRDSKDIMSDQRVTEEDIMIIEDDDPPAKKSRISDKTGTAVDLPHTQQSQKISENDNELDHETTMKLEKLLDLWQSGRGTSEAAQEMEIFCTEKISAVCKKISSAALSETALMAACQHLVSISDIISHDNCVCFLSTTLSAKFWALEQTASRAFATVIYLVAEHFPKPLTDGVLLSCIDTSDLGSSQRDVISHIIKNVFQNSSKIFFLRQLSKNVSVVNENLVAIYQTLLDSKIEIGDSLMSEMLQRFKDSSCSHAKSRIFGKFVLALVNKCGPQMTNEQVTTLGQISQQHCTFLKKSIDAALRKLK